MKNPDISFANSNNDDERNERSSGAHATSSGAPLVRWVRLRRDARPQTRDPRCVQGTSPPPSTYSTRRPATGPRRSSSRPNAGASRLRALTDRAPPLLLLVTRPRPQARREASLPKVKLIRALQDDAIRRRREKVYDATSMAVTARLLEINPEVLTAWNFRREAIVLAGDETRASGRRVSSEHRTNDPERTHSFAPTLADELALTERCLRKNPKSYPAWHHRKWCVARRVYGLKTETDAETESHLHATGFADERGFPVASLLATELAMAQTLLDLDDRNFHGWGYRRFVTSLANGGALETRSAARDWRARDSGENAEKTRSVFDARSRSRSCDRKRRSLRGLRACGAAVQRGENRTQLLQLLRLAPSRREPAARVRGSDERTRREPRRRRSRGRLGERVRVRAAGVLHRAGGPGGVDVPPVAHRADKKRKRGFAAPGEDAGPPPPRAAKARRSGRRSRRPTRALLLGARLQVAGPDARQAVRLAGHGGGRGRERGARFAELARLDPARRGFCDCCRV